MTRQKTREEERQEYVIQQIIKLTSFWTIDMWHDLRNVFIPDYYEIRQKTNRPQFNEWKLKMVKEYNTLIEKI